MSLAFFTSIKSLQWARSEIRWVGTYLSFPGRIDREQWVAQAANIAAGGGGSKDDQTHTHLPAGKTET